MQKRERLGLPPGDTDPYLEQFSDSEWEIPDDPPELEEARKKLSMHMKCASEGVCLSESAPCRAIHSKFIS